MAPEICKLPVFVRVCRFVQQFRELLMRSTLGERRPVDDDECLEGMLENCNLIITALDGGRPVGLV